MAFDSTSTITLSKPVLKFTVNDWVVTVNPSIPNISFTLEPLYMFNMSLPVPEILSSFGPANIYNLTSILKKPSISFSIINPNLWALSSTIPKPNITGIISSNIQAVLNKRFQLPRVTFETILTATTVKQTWVFNTITTAHSRYTNYDFNSFFKIGSTNYGINDYGIYALTGTKDFVGEASEANINAEVVLPATTYDEQQLKSCSDAIIYGRGDGYTEVAVVLDEQQERTGYSVYFDSRTGMHRKRVKIPKGLKGNVWQFKIRNVDGAHFDINLFEVFVKSMQRLKW